MIKDIYILAQSVRDHINTHRYQSVLITKHDVWNQICSSLDVIDDSLSAISSYLESDFPVDVGAKYLSVYGILQALFIQQDALKNLTEAFDIEYPEDQKLKNIREIRNAAIGHPTKLNRKKSVYYFHIVQHSISKKGFELFQYSGTGTKRIQVDILELIDQQLDTIVSKYKFIVEELRKMDNKHKEEFQKKSLQDIFHSGMSYSFQKISSGIEAAVFGKKDWGRANLEIIIEAYKKFKDELVARRELNDWIEHDLNQFFHAIRRLEEIYDNSDSWMTKQDAHIYLNYLINQHQEFVDIAKEIDKSYKSKNT